MSNEPSAPPLPPRPKPLQTSSSLDAGQTLITNKNKSSQSDYTVFEELDIRENDNISNLSALLRLTTIPHSRRKIKNVVFGWLWWTHRGTIDVLKIRVWIIWIPSGLTEISFPHRTLWQRATSSSRECNQSSYERLQSWGKTISKARRFWRWWRME